MITVDEALERLFALVKPLEAEEVPLRYAAGRVLAQTMKAGRDQPPFAASAMDGYAVRKGDIAPGATLTVVGEAAAGHAWDGELQSGQALRIFTGAPLPPGANHVVIQENVARSGDRITLDNSANDNSFVRPAGADFRLGHDFAAPKRLNPSDIALVAAMNIAVVPVARKPVIAIIATGDELVQPGEAPHDDQIIASNSYGLAALLEQAGAEVRLLPIARDTEASLEHVFQLANGADLIVTIGGASVGDHDLVGRVAQDTGMRQSFYKVAMRPGKPLMAGRLGDAAMVGLPGNPVSAMVCGHVFVLPMVRKMLGLPAAPAPRRTLPLAHDIPANGLREHYMRAQITPRGVTVFDRQDSALLTVLSQANCLAIRSVNDPDRRAGDMIDIIDITA